MAKVTFHFEHRGFRFRRTSSSKIYTHAVLTRESLASDRLECERIARSTFELNRNWNEQIAAGAHPLAEDYPDQYPPARLKAETEAAQACLAAGVEGAVRSELMRFDERAALQQTAEDGDTYFLCYGWCSRPDLATKLAAQAKRPTVIVEVEVAA